VDTGVSPIEETDEGDFGLQREDSEEICANDKSQETQSDRCTEPFPEEINDIDQLKVTADHLFPNFNNWIRSLEDPRAQEKVTFAAEHLVWLGLLLFIFRFGSRWQLYSFRKRGNFRNNLNDLAGEENATVAHPDTLNYFLKKLPVEELENLKVAAAKQLIRDKRLLSGRLFGEYRVAIDATGLFSFD
jgi:hypothetical protein